MSNKVLKILIAPDKFKGSLSAPQVCDILSKAILRTLPNTAIKVQPMADGGDGSIDLLEEIWEMEKQTLPVHDPLFRSIEASYFTGKGIAWIEMAKASGIALLKEDELNARKTSSFGTGELIKDALEKGYSQIKLFIGGSATNDAALGIASALGYRFLDESGCELQPIGESLIQVHHIEIAKLENLDLEVVCDVNNPFFGPQGAAFVYAPQKGASQEDVFFLDEGLIYLHQRFLQHGMLDVQNLPGAGAAGGIGGGLVAMFGARLIPGIELFSQQFNLRKQIAEADWVISGEGRLDSQSLQGKVVGGVADICQKLQKPLLVVCGQNTLAQEVWQGSAIQQIFSLLDLAPSVENAIQQAAHYLEKLGEEVGNFLRK